MDKNRSMVDVAYELMSKKKKAVNFYKLWQEVSEVKGFDEEEKNEKETLFGAGNPDAVGPVGRLRRPACCKRRQGYGGGVYRRYLQLHDALYDHGQL